MKLCLSKLVQLGKSTKISKDVVKYNVEMLRMFLVQLKGLLKAYHMEHICQKLEALGWDGASVIAGKSSGVITLLHGDKPSVIVVHCCGKRFELAYKDAVHKSTLAEKLSTLLPGLYCFYINSALNRTNLKNASKFLGMKVLLPTWDGGTRWVSYVSKDFRPLFEWL